MKNVVCAHVFTVIWCGISSPCSTSLLCAGCSEPADPSVHLVATAPHQPLTAAVWFSRCHHSERWLRLDSGSSIPPPPQGQQGFLPVFSFGFFVERQLGWSSERTRLCLLDSPELCHWRSFSVVLQRRWQHLFFTFLMAREAFLSEWKSSSLFHSAAKLKPEEKRRALQR